MRRSFVAFLALASMLLLAVPANAKGISYAHFTGPGLPTGGVTITGDHEVLWQTGLAGTKTASSDDLLISRDELGTAYRASYRVDYVPKVTLHQTLYPYAEGGPVAFMKAQHIGQDYGSFPGGWHQGFVSLLRFLVAHGFPARDPNAAQLVHVETAANDLSTGTSGGLAWPWVVGALLGMLALAATAVVTRRRYRSF